MDPFLSWLQSNKMFGKRASKFIKARQQYCTEHNVPYLLRFCTRYDHTNTLENSSFSIVNRIKAAEGLDLEGLKVVLNAHDGIFEHAIRENGSVELIEFLETYGGYTMTDECLKVAEECGRDELVAKYKKRYCIIS